MEKKLTDILFSSSGSPSVTFAMKVPLETERDAFRRTETFLGN